jgi:hypothetical protein
MEGPQEVAKSGKRGSEGRRLRFNPRRDKPIRKKKIPLNNIQHSITTKQKQLPILHP